MKVISTLTSKLHLEIQLKNLTHQELKRKQYRKNREEFLKRVHKTLGKNFVK